MTPITTIPDLEALYGTPGEASLLKVARKMTPEYAAWITASKFCILSTVGAEGTDASPRGDDGPVVRILDAETLALPDWRGNQRLDSLRNIVSDGRVSLMFMIAGQNNVIRVNGTATLTADPDLCASFEQKRKHPATVIVVKIGEIYSQCARALMRADLWGGDADVDLPSMGDILKAQKDGNFDGATYDREWAGRAKDTMW